MKEAARSSSFVHRYVPAARPGAPVLLLLHGTGGDENDLVSLGQALSEYAALLSPRGKVLENGNPRFFRRLAEGVFDVEDLISRTHELAEFVIAARSDYGFESDPVIAVGFSNGANISASLILLRPEVLNGAILFRPMVPLTPQTLPVLGNLPVWAGASRNDPFIAPKETERLIALLRKAGADVTLRWGEGGHSITGAEVDAARAWLTQHFPLVET
jgi:predicted esterase